MLLAWLVRQVVAFEAGLMTSKSVVVLVVLVVVVMTALPATICLF